MVRLLLLALLLTSAAPAPAPTWAAFGDGAMAGVGVPPAASYIGQLQLALGAIDNQAQEGADTAQQVALMRDHARPLRAVLWLPGGDDLRAGRAASDYRAALDAGLALLAARGATVYLAIPMREPTAPDALSDAYEAETIAAAAPYANVVIVRLTEYGPLAPYPDQMGHGAIARAFARAIAARAPFRAALPEVVGP